MNVSPGPDAVCDKNNKEPINHFLEYIRGRSELFYFAIVVKVVMAVIGCDGYL